MNQSTINQAQSTTQINLIMMYLLLLCLLIVVNSQPDGCSTQRWFTSTSTFLPSTPEGAYFDVPQVPSPPGASGTIDVTTIAGGGMVDSYRGAAVQPGTKLPYVAFTKVDIIGSFLGTMNLVGTPLPNPTTFSAALTEVAPIIDAAGNPLEVESLAFE